MTKTRQNRSPKFKLDVAIEALKDEKDITEIGSKYGLHPKQVRRWRDQLLAEGEELFVHKATKKKRDEDPDKKELRRIIDQLSSELDYLKKKLGKLR